MSTERNKKIEEILNSLDGVQHASAPDFFFTRLRAKMEQVKVDKASRPWLLRPAFALVVSVIVLIINVTLLIQRKEKETVTPLADTENFQSIVSAYSLNDNVAYDQNQEK